MDKPEKKEYICLENMEGRHNIDGYNQACAEWEKYHKQEMDRVKSELPSEIEIYEIIREKCAPKGLPLRMGIYISNLISKLLEGVKRRKKIFACELGKNHCVSGLNPCEDECVENGYCKHYKPEWRDK